MLEPPPLDASRPNIARVYDYELGGNDNYAADRAEAERLVAIYPHLPKLVGTTGCSWPERWPGWPGEASGSFSTSTRAAHRAEHTRSPEPRNRIAMPMSIPIQRWSRMPGLWSQIPM
jgi:hypothetical protein